MRSAEKGRLLAVGWRRRLKQSPDLTLGIGYLFFPRPLAFLCIGIVVGVGIGRGVSGRFCAM